MLYKEHLSRIGQPLNEETERRKAERRKERKKHSVEELQYVGSDSEEDEEDDPSWIKCELEWWQKPGTAIIN